MQSKFECRRSSGEAGMMIIVVSFVVILVAGLSLGFLTNGMAERTSVIHHETSMHALEIAEMGLVHAESRIRGKLAADSDTLTDTYANGEYEVGIERDPVRRHRWTLKARSGKGLSERRIEVELRVFQLGDFTHGLFGKQSLDIRSTSTTDSFDSRLGPYLTQAVNVDAYGPYADADAHAGSNGPVGLDGTSKVRGDAIPGPLSTTTIVGDSSVLGDTVPLEQEVPIPDTPYDEFAAALASNNNGEIGNGQGIQYNAATYSLRVNAGGNVVLSGGTYFFTDLILQGGGMLTINGPSTFYVTGRLNVGGGQLVNPSGLAQNLIVNAHPYALPQGHNPSDLQLVVNGSASTAMAVYAPERDIMVDGGSPFFGSIVGRSVTLQGGTQFHYDRALGDLSWDRKARVERVYWREATPPPR